jgi:endonuclease/exonuclease/phosphatase family metal-dependent hydrolase
LNGLERAGAGRYWLIWAAVVPVALWAFVRAFGLERGFPLTPLIAYTPYAAIAALLVAGIALALRNWAAAGATGLATLCLAAAVLPRAVGSETVDPDGRERLVVLAANIHHGTADPEALVDLVRHYRPDLLCIQELTPSFAHELGHAGLGRLLPESVLVTRRSVSGSGIYSRLPLSPLPEPGRFHFRMPRALAELPGGRRVRVVSVHPVPPLRKDVAEWSTALESLPDAGRGTPWLLAGDFNATLDHAELRDVLGRGYRDAGDAAGEGLEPTWPSGSYRSPPVTIDHVLADERLGVVEYEVEDLPGSDHRAVYAQLALP